jgi:hypothetical protein
MIYNDICDCIKFCEDHIMEGGIIITKTLLLQYNLPLNIKELIKNEDDLKLFKNIINLYYNNFSIICNNSQTLKDALENFSEIKFISNKNNEKKEKAINFNDEISKWLYSTEFFNDIYENYCKNNINSLELEPTNKIEKLVLRENQLEAFEILNKNGLQTGIHCQATGCGKTFIIIKYIDYINKIKSNPKIILFTERINILSDLFCDDKNKLKVNQDNILYWKNAGIGDLTNFDIINRVTNKKKDWDDIMNNSIKPTILIINRSFLTHEKKYKNIDKDNIDLILHDECHNTTSIECHNFLKHYKSLNVTIVGFSATPLRTGKYDKDKLLEIYSNNSSDLELLTNYNMIYAINKNLILPPEFHWYQLETTRKHKTNNNIISDEEVGSVFEILNNLVETLPNKKIIAWCGTIILAEKWIEKIKETYKQRKNLKNFIFGLDTSKEITDDYNNFSKIPKNNNDIIPLEELQLNDPRRMYYGNSILFCANKHREGSDIKLLDACIFLDKVKDRGAIPFIQSIGRTLRKCQDTPSKTKGVIIDGVVKDENYEKNFVNKIFDYYLALENINNLCDKNNKYDQYVKIKDVVKFDKEKLIINMNLGANIIKIHCNKLEWKNIIKNFDKILEEKLQLSDDDIFKIYINKIKDLEQFKDIKNDFWEEYKKLDHEKLGLPKDIYNEYKNIWEKNTWYDLLGHKNVHISLKEFKQYFYKFFPTYKKCTEKIYKKLKNNLNLPEYPFEYYRLYKIYNYNDLI